MTLSFHSSNIIRLLRKKKNNTSPQISTNLLPPESVSMQQQSQYRERERKREKERERCVRQQQHVFLKGNDTTTSCCSGLSDTGKIKLSSFTLKLLHIHSGISAQTGVFSASARHNKPERKELKTLTLWGFPFFLSALKEKNWSLASPSHTHSDFRLSLSPKGHSDQDLAPDVLWALSSLLSVRGIRGGWSGLLCECCKCIFYRSEE